MQNRSRACAEHRETNAPHPGCRHCELIEQRAAMRGDPGAHSELERATVAKELADLIDRLRKISAG